MISRLAAGAAALVLFAAAPVPMVPATPALAQEAAAPAAKAESADTKAKGTKAKEAPTPIDIVSNEMEILDKEKKAIFRGAVDATKGTTNIKSDTLTVIYADVKQPDGTTKTDATDIDARGNVTIKTPDETITGDWAKYDPQAEKLTVGGKVKLVQGATVLQGNELVSDLKTKRTEMKGGRVRGSFLPK